MSAESFDDFISSDSIDETEIDKPFQFRDDKSEEGTLDWLNKNFNAKHKKSESRMRTYRRQHALYKGIHWKHQETRDFNRENGETKRKPRHTVNFIFDMIEAKVAQAAGKKIGFTVMPKHDEQDDINDCEYAKLCIDSRNESVNMEGLQQEADRIKYQFGHVVTLIPWDKDLGPMYPKLKKLKERYPDGFPPKLKAKLKKVDRLNVGDVDVILLGPDRCFPQLNVKEWKKLEEFEYIEWININELKADYPDKTIQENDMEYFDFDLNEISIPKNMCMVRHAYFKKTKHNPEGDYIKYINSSILEWTEYPYEDDGELGLPIVEDADMRVYGELWGRASNSQIEQMQRMYNNIQSGIARDFGRGSAPKWLMPKGMCSVSSLNDDFTVVEYTGQVPPQLVANNPVSPKAFEIQDRLESKMTKLMRVYDVSRGVVPTGITANSALRFLDEQETKSLVVSEYNRKRRIIETYRFMLRRFKQFYKKGDERTVKILGPNNDYLIESVKDADFSRTDDVVIQSSSSLPDTKGGKISAIVDLNTSTQKDPVFGKEEIIQMLDLGLDRAFISGATVAVNAAKTILSKILKGKEVPEPQEFDNHLVHYSVFDKFIQSTTFKTSIKEETQNIIKQRIMVIEMLMYEKAKINKAFCMKLMNMDNYPMFYKMPAPLTIVLQSFEPIPMQGGAATPPPTESPIINPVGTEQQ